MDWLAEAKKLPLGRKQRMVHGCAHDKSLIVSHGDNGYSAYCFRCGNVGFEAYGKRSLAELARVRELNEAAQLPQPQELPDDLTTEIPSAGLRWLRNGGLYSTRAIRAMGVGYSPRLQRVVIPVGDSYWQARAVHRDQTPKYLNPRAGREAVLYTSKRTVSEGLDDSRRGCGVVVTEDILSAERVGRHMPACSALGTKLSTAQALKINSLAGGGVVRLWLDPDKAGRDGAALMRKQISLLSDSVQIVESDADPKCLNDRVIREILGLPPNHNYTYFGED